MVSDHSFLDATHAIPESPHDALVSRLTRMRMPWQDDIEQLAVQGYEALELYQSE